MKTINEKTQQVKDQLKSYKIFSDAEMEEFLQIGTFVNYKKGDYFIQEGKISTHIALIDSGILRSYYFNQDGDEITYCLSFPKSFTTAYSSYITQEPSAIHIQALSDAELFVVQKNEMDRLVEYNNNWLLFQKHIAEQYFMTLEKRVFEHQKEKAENRYDNLIRNRPEYIKEIPLQYIASYLGITQRHLSRIRGKATI